MRFDIFTLFPDICNAYLQESILKRAQEMGAMQANVHNIREYAAGKHRVTDDLPYGGGGGMVMKPEPIFNAVETVLGRGEKKEEGRETFASVSPPSSPFPSPRIILLTPQGRVFTQAVAQELAGAEHIALICGRYEGFDERIRQHLVTDEISIGDYVLTGGELGALVIVDAITRLLPGVLGDPTGAQDDSHASGLLEYPHYTRPLDFRGWTVPEILISGDHGKVAKWRRLEALRRTFLRRPDMLLKLELTEEEKVFLSTVAEELSKA